MLLTTVTRPWIKDSFASPPGRNEKRQGFPRLFNDYVSCGLQLFAGPHKEQKELEHVEEIQIQVQSPVNG